MVRRRTSRCEENIPGDENPSHPRAPVTEAGTYVPGGSAKACRPLVMTGEWFDEGPLVALSSFWTGFLEANGFYLFLAFMGLDRK